MFRKCLFLALSPVFCFSVATQVQARDLIPAGTLLHCTMDEPNFSSKTAQVGDPVLCNLGPVGSFGHSAFPRGAQLSGHLQDFKKPGHFFGKGWISLEFDRVILPGAEVLPLSAKITGAPHNKVDAKGDIKGKGHPTRDAVLWAIPLFWPVKILTLPARGPYPTLKGETRLTLRLMEDVEVPYPTAARNNVPMPDYRPSSYRGSLPALYPRTSAAYQPAATSGSAVSVVQPVTFPGREPRIPVSDGQLTVIALQAGRAVIVSRYWIDGSDLHWVTREGAEENAPLSLIDLAETVKVNQERNVAFSLHSRLPDGSLRAVEQ